MTLEEYIRSKLTTNDDGEFLFDAWIDTDGRVHIKFIEWGETGPEFVVNKNAVELIDGKEQKL